MQKINITTNFLQEFQRIYNRIYSRYYHMDSWDSDKLTSKITEEQSKAWISEAFKARQEYKSGEISGDEMLERIRID